MNNATVIKMASSGKSTPSYCRKYTTNIMAIQTAKTLSDTKAYFMFLL